VLNDQNNFLNHSVYALALFPTLRLKSISAQVLTKLTVPGITLQSVSCNSTVLFWC